eukprot:TRINITY_DN3131_c0_g1_i2.p4 TRINITY_DN3131_c0_g1~~TRINITY_DN3131_c0_g1_i2.p4  ORF type:complete len:115 (-),score=19.86 TRINITY_DN3131_c0_g1_i2:794-1138(-)
MLPVQKAIKEKSMIRLAWNLLIKKPASNDAAVPEKQTGTNMAATSITGTPRATSRNWTRNHIQMPKEAQPKATQVSIMLISKVKVDKGRRGCFEKNRSTATNKAINTTPTISNT